MNINLDNYNISDTQKEIVRLIHELYKNEKFKFGQFKRQARKFYGGFTPPNTLNQKLQELRDVGLLDHRPYVYWRLRC